MIERNRRWSKSQIARRWRLKCTFDHSIWRWEHFARKLIKRPIAVFVIAAMQFTLAVDSTLYVVRFCSAVLRIYRSPSIVQRNYTSIHVHFPYKRQMYATDRNCSWSQRHNAPLKLCYWRRDWTMKNILNILQVYRDVKALLSKFISSMISLGKMLKKSSKN